MSQYEFHCTCLLPLLESSNSDEDPPGLRAAARPRSATFIHFCVDLPWPHVASSRGGIARSLRGPSLFTVPRVRGSPRSSIGHVPARVRTYASALASTSRQLTSSDSYTFIGSRVPSLPLLPPCHASRPLINFITRPESAWPKVFRRGRHERRAWLLAPHRHTGQLLSIPYIQGVLDWLPTRIIGYFTKTQAEKQERSFCPAMTSFSSSSFFEKIEVADCGLVSRTMSIGRYSIY